MLGGLNMKSASSLLSKSNRRTHHPPAHASLNLSAAVDWRKSDAVTPADSQQQCGSCYAFMSLGTLEGQHFIKTGKLIPLSVQNILDCSGKYGNMGYNGGLMDASFQYIKDNKGVDADASYSYEAVDGKCRFKRENVAATDTGFIDIEKGNETALTIAIATVGPISTAMDASQPSFQFYSSGVYDEPKCTSDLDHTLVLVGYGTATNGTKKQDYYI
ncbi:unnamed protein product [Rotaria sordida]|uniref:Peptidase C1A papain C-terminal domain-containing protein n=1 Tax=Rotaria sordida TaxID=392033 RepID=A0A815VW45_9BILA|nr:unnamed protein product [Rotaria sordida]CAF1534050.1 unnamed protein product [Rotaria sordida]